VHSGRQYIFELNPSVSIDATFAGNPARFINHSTTSNCVALGETLFSFHSFLLFSICDLDLLKHNAVYLVFLVNGEHRIGVYAGMESFYCDLLFASVMF